MKAARILQAARYANRLLKQARRFDRRILRAAGAVAPRPASLGHAPAVASCDLQALRRDVARAKKSRSVRDLTLGGPRAPALGGTGAASVTKLYGDLRLVVARISRSVILLSLLLGGYG